MRGDVVLALSTTSGPMRSVPPHGGLLFCENHLRERVGYPIADWRFSNVDYQLVYPDLSQLAIGNRQLAIA